MLELAPSATAWSVAVHRAVHQVADDARTFQDPLAVRILSLAPEALDRVVKTGRDSSRGMRRFVAARARIAEDALAEAVEARGASQMVVLGAGLDTFGYRNPFEGRVRVFEVDHPATQAWKQHRLFEAGVDVPPSLAFAPIDFERDRLMDALVEAGLDPRRRTLFSWLGVVAYLTPQAVDDTLSQIAALPGGAEVVFDYSDPPHTLSPVARAQRARRAAQVAELGEPFITTFDPAELHARLAALGLSTITDLGPRELRARFGPPPAPGAPNRGGHVIIGATPALSGGAGRVQ